MLMLMLVIYSNGTAMDILLEVIHGMQLRWGRG